MPKVDIAGLQIDSITKEELLTFIQSCMNVKKKTWVTTPYSEFLYAGLKDPSVFDMLNESDVSVADGIGIFWAKKFLEIPLTATSYWGKTLQAFWQAVYSLSAILFNPKWIRSALPEKISGSNLIWDIADLAAKNNLSIYLLGGFSDTPKLAADALSNRRIPRGRDLNVIVKIAGYSSKNPEDLSTIVDIKKSGADILLVAYGPINQEQWIHDHKDELPCKLFIGLGGTFDYIAGTQTPPPAFIRSVGLEWFWRLVTQPKRIGRIWNATAGLTYQLIKYKTINTLPFRKNVVSVIVNSQNNILICKRNNGYKFSVHGAKEDLTDNNHWQFPQWGIDKGENAEQTAVREAKEETGLLDLSVLKTSPTTYSYIWTNDQYGLFDNPRYKGQEQTIVYLEYTGSEQAVVVDKKEFTDFKWVPLSKIVESVHERRKPVAQIVLKDLT